MFLRKLKTKPGRSFLEALSKKHAPPNKSLQPVGLQLESLERRLLLNGEPFSVIAVGTGPLGDGTVINDG
ncbi:MAG: hypothetical protein AMJ79_10730, partial [Phycisphaerae bacterium SM23_30]